MVSFVLFFFVKRNKPFLEFKRHTPKKKLNSCVYFSLLNISILFSLFCFRFAPIILLLLLNNMVLKVIATFFFHATSFAMNWQLFSTIVLSSSTRSSVEHLSLSLCFCNSIEKKTRIQWLSINVRSILPQNTVCKLRKNKNKGIQTRKRSIFFFVCSRIVFSSS